MTSVFGQAAVIPPQFITTGPVILTAGGTSPAGLWTGHGVPTTVPGSQPGDEYIDLDTGNFYTLA